MSKCRAIECDDAPEQKQSGQNQTADRRQVGRAVPGRCRAAAVCVPAAAIAGGLGARR